MTGEMLSQDEINALLGGLDIDGANESGSASELSSEEIDALGEIGNISMGTAATTLFSLLNNHKVVITTPRVEVLTFEQLREMVGTDTIAISVGYTEGLTGMNLMLLKERDVKIIADLMMGGSGAVDDSPISELHLSAIAEAMNQMIGSASTSMSQMFNKKIDISPPQAVTLDESKDQLEELLSKEEDVVKVAFKIEIHENIIDSELMQILPLSFAKDLVSHLLSPQPTPEPEKPEIAKPASEPIIEPVLEPSYEAPQTAMQAAPLNEPHKDYEMVTNSGHVAKDVEVQKPVFPSFDHTPTQYPKENMDILMDVSLEVSVELGRTRKKIKEILEYGPGSIIELDRLVGEPIDVLVNGKFIAKGEVVVIDENFGIRITDIINRENRI